MLARCERAFRDLAEGVPREVGDTFEVTEERYKELNSTRYGQLVSDVTPPAREETPTDKPKRRTTRRKATQED